VGKGRKRKENSGKRKRGRGPGPQSVNEKGKQIQHEKERGKRKKGPKQRAQRIPKREGGEQKDKTEPGQETKWTSTATATKNSAGGLERSQVGKNIGDHGRSNDGGKKANKAGAMKKQEDRKV